MEKRVMEAGRVAIWCRQFDKTGEWICEIWGS